jgi:hypothetical protein
VRFSLDISAISDRQLFAYLVKMILAALPTPRFVAEFQPVVVFALTASYPGRGVETVAPTEDFLSGVGLLGPLIARSVDYGSLVAPVIFAVAEL